MDAEAKKFLGNLWADGAPVNRQSPEDAGIDRRDGWDLNYEQIGTGKYPERRVFNQLVREIQGGLQEHMLYGFPRWVNDVDFPQYSFVQYNVGSDSEPDVQIFRANSATGPSTNNAEIPGTGDLWRRL